MFRQWPFFSALSTEAGRVVVTLHGDVDAAAGNWLIRPLNKAISTSRPELLVDATGVTFWSVAAMQLMIAAAPVARAHDLRIVLVTDNPCVWRPARLAGLDQWVEVRERHRPPAQPVTDVG